MSIHFVSSCVSCFMNNIVNMQLCKNIKRIWKINYIFWSILQDYIPGRAVRSATRKLICERITKTATGARVVGVVAPKVWHELPDSIRSSDYITSFKKNLKTYLYHQAFTSSLATYSLRPVIECMSSFQSLQC